MKLRIVLGVLGGLLLIYGGYVLVTTVSWNRLPGLGLWLFGALVLHDGILSGLLAVARLFTRPIRRRFPLYFAIVQIAVLVGGLVTLFVVPEILGQFKGPRNPSVLPLAYVPHLFWFWVGLSFVTLIVVIVVAVVKNRHVGAHVGERLPAKHRSVTQKTARTTVGLGALLVSALTLLLGRDPKR